MYFNTSELLAAHGHEVINFALRWAENEPSPWENYFPESKESRRGSLRIPANIAGYFYHRQAARNLSSLIKRTHPDIAHIHLIWGQLTPSILRTLRKHGVPAVLTVHDFRLLCPASVCLSQQGEVCEKCLGGHFSNCVKGRCRQGSLPLSLMMGAEAWGRNRFFNPTRLLSGLIYVSDFARTLHEKHFPALKNLPSSLIYNFSLPTPEPAVTPRRDYMLFFGRLSREKGVPTLLKAAALTPEITVKLAGTGPIEAEMKAWTESHGLGNVEFLGYRSGQDLTDLITGARGVLVPSEWYENNPLSIIEAYHAGTPVIGSRIGGIPEILPDSLTGFQVPAGDARALAGAMRRLQTLPDAEYNAMRNACRSYAAENFSPEKYLDSLLSLFSRLTDKTPTDS